MKKKFDYKWIIAVMCFMTIFCALGFLSGTKSLYLTNITKYLGIDRALFSINDSIRYVTTAVISIFFGTLYNKLGPKKLIGCGFICFIASCFVYAYATSIYQFYIGGFLLGVGFALSSTTCVGYIVNRWFTTNRGTITGFVLAANGLGTAFLTQFIEPMIESAPDGYKKAYLFTAALLVVFGVVIMIFLKEKPKGFDTSSEKITKGKKRPARSTAWVGISLKDASKQPFMYLIFICMFLTGAGLQAVSGVGIPHIKDVVLTHADPAFDARFIAIALSAHAVCLTAAKFLAGFLYDHIGLRKTALSIHLIASSAMLMLAAVTSGSYTLAFIYEMIISFAMPLETVIALLIVSDCFGEKEYGKIVGINTAILTFGYAVGSPLMNLVYDKVGSYRPALFVVSGIMFVVLVTMQIVLSMANKVKKQIIESEALSAPSGD